MLYITITFHSVAIFILFNTQKKYLHTFFICVCAIHSHLLDTVIGRKAKYSLSTFYLLSSLAIFKAEDGDGLSVRNVDI